MHVDCFRGGKEGNADFFHFPERKVSARILNLKGKRDDHRVVSGGGIEEKKSKCMSRGETNEQIKKVRKKTQRRGLYRRDEKLIVVQIL